VGPTDLQNLNSTELPSIKHVGTNNIKGCCALCIHVSKIHLNLYDRQAPRCIVCINRIYTVYEIVIAARGQVHIYQAKYECPWYK